MSVQPREQGVQLVAQGSDNSGRTGRARRRPVLARESVQYTLAVLGYIALILLTKDFLTFTWGVIYYVTVLEVLPRFVRRIRGRWNEPNGTPMNGMTES
jgi:hypothetical protein